MSSQRSLAETMELERNALANESGRILTAKYIEKATSKKDLAKRLRIILKCLRDDEDVEPDNLRDYPGLAALCQSLTRFVNHRDKEIRLYTVAACMELFTIYAPEAPWNELETIEIFKQTIRQLANLGHSILASSGGGSSSSQGNLSTNKVHFYQYYRILELLAEVKIAVLLVDLSKKNDDDDCEEDVEEDSSSNGDDDRDGSDETSSISSESRRKSRKLASKKTKKANISKEALQVLSELFRTLLQSVRNEHPTEIFDFCQKTLTSCVEEFFESTILPVPILDELLVCIGQGPRVLVLQQQQTSKNNDEEHAQNSKRGRKRGANRDTPQALITVQQNNPSYMVASAVVRASVDRLSTPIATLLNGLVNSDPRSIGQSTISNHVCEISDSEDNHQKEGGAIPAEVLEMVRNLGRPQRQQQDVHGSSNVYSVILELHRVAPAILTTIFGNLASHVDTTDVSQRILVLQTLGKLFVGNQSSSKSSGGSDKTVGTFRIAYQYNPCFRRWLQRSSDSVLEIRRIMIPHLLALTRAGSELTNETSSPHAELARAVDDELIRRLTIEPSAKFRTEAVVQGLCSLSYQYRKVLSRRLMDQLGERVMSKDKSERKDVLTGLVQLHFRQYTKYHLETILAGGDDCPIESVLEVLNTCCPPASANTTSTGLKSLIAVRSKASSLLSSTSQGTASSPRKASKTKKRGRSGTRRSSRQRREVDSESEGSDNEEHYGSSGFSGINHATDDFSYYQWIPCVLFESASYKDSTDPDMHSRVVQLTDELLLGCSSPHPENRRQLTSTGRATGLAVIVYAVRNQSPLAWQWMAELQSVRAKLQTSLKGYLEARANIRKFEIESEEHFEADAEAKDLLEKVASMIPQPSGATPAIGERHPVLEKFHSMKDKHIFRILGTITNPSHSAKARARALDDLPKRVKATAGDIVQAWVKNLAKRCAMGDFINHDTIHHCILLAQECFHEGEFEASLKFLACIRLAAESFPSMCASEEVFDNLSELFRDCNHMSSSSSKKEAEASAIVTELSAILALVSPHRDSSSDSAELEKDLEMKLVSLCRNGTPEQARHAVTTMVSLLKPKESEALTQEQTDTLLPLLETLSTPSRLAIASTGSSTKAICVLVALAELADHAPQVFEASSRGAKALKFALEKVLMGHARNSRNDDDDSDSDSSGGYVDEVEQTRTPKNRKTRKSKDYISHLSPSGGGQNPVEDESLSVSCRTLCAAIEFLSTFIRSSIFVAKKTQTLLPKTCSDLIDQVFKMLSQILRDQGLPPSSKDRKLCSLRQDRAALRQCAAIHLFRLCDTRLGLDQKHLTLERWNYLASILLDDERVVREAVVEELGLMITGNGKFAATLGMGAMAPRLRFVAISVFCIDGSNGSHSSANGNAANIGKVLNYYKENVARCIGFLRKIHEISAAQCRARGPEAEKKFDTHTKQTVMPEFSVPYAFYLLACRHETPLLSGSGRKRTGNGTNNDDYEVDESGQKVLKKRLKTLYDPLVLQLGATADNISFLLRMAEMIGKSFEPICCTSIGFGNGNGKKEQDKLINICATAREVLLSYVKTDANLNTHPGEIRMPGNLFRTKEIRKMSPAAKSPKTEASPIPKKKMQPENHISQESNKSRLGEEIKNNDPIIQNGRRQRITRRTSASTKTYDDSKSNMSTDTDSTSQKKDVINQSIDSRNNKRKAPRRSTRSTRSTKFDDLNDSTISNSIDYLPEHDDFEDVGGIVQLSQSAASNADDSANSNILHSQSPEGKENLSNTRRNDGANKKRRSGMSQGSHSNSRVHFSPEADFGSLSPINRRSSHEYTKHDALLSSSETKTRGTTPPSTLRNVIFTATASVAGSARSTDLPDSVSPTTVSESPMNGKSKTNAKPKPLEDKEMKLNQSGSKRSTSKLVANDKENTNLRITKKKKEIPKQIKIVRSKPNQKLQIGKTQRKTHARTVKRNRGKKTNPVDSFDFSG